MLRALTVVPLLLLLAASCSSNSNDASDPVPCEDVAVGTSPAACEAREDCVVVTALPWDDELQCFEPERRTATHCLSVDSGGGAPWGAVNPDSGVCHLFGDTRTPPGWDDEEESCLTRAAGGGEGEKICGSADYLACRPGTTTPLKLEVRRDGIPTLFAEVDEECEVAEVNAFNSGSHTIELACPHVAAESHDNYRVAFQLPRGQRVELPVGVLVRLILAVHHADEGGSEDLARLELGGQTVLALKHDSTDWASDCSEPGSSHWRGVTDWLPQVQLRDLQCSVSGTMGFELGESGELAAVGEVWELEGTGLRFYASEASCLPDYSWDLSVAAWRPE